MSGLARVVLAGVVVAGLCAGVPAGHAQSREEAVQAVLDQREAAVRAGDREQFLTTVDPAASDEFRSHQERLFEGLRSVPFSLYELELRTDEIPDLSAGLEDRYLADDVFLPPVELRYRIEGADGIDAVDALFYTFLQREGRWRIVSDTDLEELGLPSARNSWDFGPVAEMRSPHFTVLFDPGQRPRAGMLLELAEEAWSRLVETFTRPVPDRVVMVLPGSLDQLRDILQATFDLTNFVAFASASVDRDDGFSTTAPRVFVQDLNLARSGRAFQLATLHHELVHVAAFPLAGPNVPAWVHEGVADWMATGRGGSEPVPGSDDVLPEDFEFTTGGGTAIVRSYEESTSAIAFLAEEKGSRAPLDLLAGAGEARIAPGTADYHTDAALQPIYGAGLAEFQRRWGAVN